MVGSGSGLSRLARKTTLIALEHFPFSHSGSIALRDASNSQKSRGLKPAARNTETGNALDVKQQGLSPSPRFQRTTRSALSDRTPGLGLLGGQGFAPTSLRRTGQATLMASGSTGRHRSGWYTPSCEDASAPLAKLVRPGLPRDASHLDGVSHVVRRRRPRGRSLVHSTVAYSGKEGHGQVLRRSWPTSRRPGSTLTQAAAAPVSDRRDTR